MNHSQVSLIAGTEKSPGIIFGLSGIIFGFSQSKTVLDLNLNIMCSLIRDIYYTHITECCSQLLISQYSIYGPTCSEHHRPKLGTKARTHGQGQSGLNSATQFSGVHENMIIWVTRLDEINLFDKKGIHLHKKIQWPKKLLQSRTRTNSGTLH